MKCLNLEQQRPGSRFKLRIVQPQCFQSTNQLNPDPSTKYEMSSAGRKRRASSDEDLEVGVSAKKSKNEGTSAGNDDEGNPFWEVSLGSRL